MWIEDKMDEVLHFIKKPRLTELPKLCLSPIPPPTTQQIQKPPTLTCQLPHGSSDQSHTNNSDWLASELQASCQDLSHPTHFQMPNLH